MTIEGDMGWIRTKVRQWVAMLRLWNKLIQMPDNCLTKNVFTWSYDLCQNWSSEVKEVFCSINMEHVYTTKTVFNLDFMKTECKKIDESQWLASLPLKPKLRTYILYKMSFITEDYVKYCLNRRKRSLTAEIRIGTLPLHIETGRFRNVKIEVRVCQVCKNGDVKNEFHFICICYAYSTLRNTMYDKINDVTFYNMTDRDKFVYLMQLSQYIETAWD